MLSPLTFFSYRLEKKDYNVIKIGLLKEEFAK